MKSFEQEYENYDDPIDDIYPEVFYEQVRQDTFIDVGKLDQDSVLTPGIHHKYLAMLKRARMHLKTIETDHKNIVHGLYIYYEGRAPAQAYKERPLDITFNTKGELERYIHAEPAFQASEKILHLWQLRVDYLEKLVNQISARSYHVNNAIQYLKFVKGEL